MLQIALVDPFSSPTISKLGMTQAPVMNCRMVHVAHSKQGAIDRIILKVAEPLKASTYLNMPQTMLPAIQFDSSHDYNVKVAVKRDPGILLFGDWLPILTEIGIGIGVMFGL